MFNFFNKKRQPEKLWFATDIHCHVIPGIDDGSPDVETSVELVERMHGWGINRIIASPHITYGTFENTAETIAGPREDLRAALAERGIGVELSNSAENRIDDLFLGNLAEGTLITMPGDRVLVENSFIQEPWNLDQLMFDLQIKGLQPILAHPERYPYYYGKGTRYKAIHDAGTAFQINILSLAGYYGRDEKRWAEHLIEKGFVDYIGTDLHRAAHADAIDAYLASKDYLRHRAALEGKIHNDAI